MRAGFLVAVLLVAGGYTWLAFADLSYLSSAGRLGPGFFPRIIGLCLVALCGYSLYADLKERAAEAAPEQRAAGAAPEFLRTTLILAALSAAFVALLDVLGGLLAMIAFLGAALAIFNRGRSLQNALLALILPLCVYLLFSVWLNAAMPRGMLPLPL